MLRDGPGLTAFGFLYDTFKPEPTQNITVGSKKTQPGQSAAGSSNNGPHRLQTDKENKDEPTSRTHISVAIATICRNQKHLKC